MKFFKFTLFLLSTFLVSSIAFSQENTTTTKPSMEDMLEKLSEEQQSQVLAKALQLSGKNSKKLLKKAMKKLSEDDKKVLFDLAEDISKPKPKLPEGFTRLTPPSPTKEPEAPTVPLTNITFKETTFDFGTIISGEKIAYSFQFINSGNEPLIISNAKGSCGCTVPQWPKSPIPIGGTGEIQVIFDSKNKKGPRNQKVTLTANTDPPQTFIFLKGNVVMNE